MKFSNKKLIDHLKKNKFLVNNEQYIEIKQRKHSVLLTQHPESMMEWLRPNGKKTTHFYLPKYSFVQSQQMTQGQEDCLKSNGILVVDGLILDAKNPMVVETLDNCQDLENLIIIEEDRDQLELYSMIESIFGLNFSLVGNSDVHLIK